MPAHPRIPFFRPEITAEDIRAVTAVLRSGRLAMGDRVAAFEAGLARRCGTRHAVAVSSGTAALHLALLAAGIKPGDEVITTPFTYVATVNAILHANATPVFVDIDADTFNLDVTRLRGALSRRTRAILPVHVFGRPCEMDAVNTFARKHGLVVIEDSCEALGSQYHGTPAGGCGLAGTFGFYPNKQITTGEGGAVVTNSRNLAEICRSLRHQGRSEDQDGGFIRLGFNYKMTDIQAELGRSQLRRLGRTIRGRNKVAGWYRRSLQGVDAVSLPVPPAHNTEISWFVWVVRLAERYRGKARDEIIRSMNRTGIGAVNYFPALHLQPFLEKLLGHARGDFPVTEDVAARTIALPFYPTMAEHEVRTVCDVLVRELHPARRSR